MTTHTLKIQKQYADAVLNGTKTFEIRKNDRNFKVGDKAPAQRCILPNRLHPR